MEVETHWQIETNYVVLKERGELMLKHEQRFATKGQHRQCLKQFEAVKLS